MKTTISKRLISLTTALMLVFTLFILLPEGALRARALDRPVYIDADGNEWTYDNIDDEYINIYQLKKPNTNEIRVPSEIDGLPVKYLTYCSYPTSHKNITKVTIPASISGIIGDGAFSSMDKLETIEFEDGSQLTSIPYLAFQVCKSLKNIKLPQHVKWIGRYAFSHCESLESLTIPGMVERLDDHLVLLCSSLKYVVIPRSVTYIDPTALIIKGTQYVPKIYGFSGTAAEEYANAHGIEFEALDSYNDKTYYNVKTYGCTITYRSYNAIKQQWNYKTVSELPMNVRSGSTESYTLNADDPPEGMEFDCFQAKYTVYATETATGKRTTVFQDNINQEKKSFKVKTPDAAINNMGEYLISNLTEPGAYTFEGEILIASHYINSSKPTVYIWGGGKADASEYANVSVASGKAGQTGTVKVTIKEGCYSVREVVVKDSKLKETAVTKVDDSTYTFVYPEGNFNVYVLLNIMKNNGSIDFILPTDGSTVTPYSITNNMADSMMAIIDYLKYLGKADYTVSGDVWTVDIDGSGKNDFTFNTKTMEITRLASIDLPHFFKYYPKDTALSAITDRLISQDIWEMNNGIYITTNYNVTAKNLGAVTLDLTSGSVASDVQSLMENPELMNTMSMIGMFMENDMINYQENKAEEYTLIDLNKDDVYDLKLTNTSLDVLSPIGDSYTVGMTKEQAEQYKKFIENNGDPAMTEFYDGVKILFKKSDRLPGDVNGDGKVDLTDVIVLKQFLAKWKVTINESNADVDGDGKVSVADVIILKQFLANWKVTLK